jgi:hypothetical protein
LTTLIRSAAAGAGVTTAAAPVAARTSVWRWGGAAASASRDGRVRTSAGAAAPRSALEETDVNRFVAPVVSKSRYASNASLRRGNDP